MGRRSLLAAARSSVIALRQTLRDMRNDGVAVDLIGEVDGACRDLESALAGDGGGLHVDARPATLADGRTADEPPWYVWRVGRDEQGGAPDLLTAFAELRVYMCATGARTGAIFAGQPSDGARVIMRLDLDGLAAPMPAAPSCVNRILWADRA